MNKSKVNTLGRIKGRKIHDAGTIGMVEGLDFSKGGKAEIRLDGNDLSSLLREIIKMEGNIETNDTKLGWCLKMLSKRYFGSKVIFRFKAQIGAHRVEFKPIIKEV